MGKTDFSYRDDEIVFYGRQVLALPTNVDGLVEVSAADGASRKSMVGFLCTGRTR